MKKLPKFKDDELYEVECFDAFGFGGWAGPQEIEEGLTNPCTMKVVGYFIIETDEIAVFAQGIGGDDKFHTILRPEFIIKGAIVNVKKLAPARK